MKVRHLKRRQPFTRWRAITSYALKFYTDDRRGLPVRIKRLIRQRDYWK